MCKIMNRSTTINQHLTRFSRGFHCGHEVGTDMKSTRAPITKSLQAFSEKRFRNATLSLTPDELGSPSRVSASQEVT